MAALNVMEKKKTDALYKYSHEAIKNSTLGSNKKKIKKNKAREGFYSYNDYSNKEKDKSILKK